MACQTYRALSAAALVFVSFLSGAPALTAQQPLVLYDDFSQALIAPDRWRGLDTDSTSEQAREVRANALRLATRVYSHPAAATFRAAVSAVRFVDPASVRAMRAELRVMSMQAQSCSPTGGIARASANISGAFFKSGGALPAGDRTNDVRAGISIRHDSSFADPDALVAAAFVSRCADAACSAAPVLASAPLDADVRLKTKVPVTVEWDEDGMQFVFTYGNDPPVAISYASLVAPPYTAAGIDEKAISARGEAPGCGGGNRSVAFMDLQVDDVYVNATP